MWLDVMLEHISRIIQWAAQARPPRCKPLAQVPPLSSPSSFPGKLFICHICYLALLRGSSGWCAWSSLGLCYPHNNSVRIAKTEKESAWPKVLLWASWLGGDWTQVSSVLVWHLSHYPALHHNPWNLVGPWICHFFWGGDTRCFISPSREGEEGSQM